MNDKQKTLVRRLSLALIVFAMLFAAFSSYLYTRFHIDLMSPGQIAGVLRKEGISICKQTIYNHVHADKTGKLARHMPHELKYNRRAEADGKRFGDWEMDTIVDAHGHAILTLTERSTNFILMERLKEGRKAAPTAKAVVRLLLPYRKYVKTITTDNGCEFAAHMDITKGLTVKGGEKVVVYFAAQLKAKGKIKL